MLVYVFIEISVSEVFPKLHRNSTRRLYQPPITFDNCTNRTMWTY